MGIKRRLFINLKCIGKLIWVPLVFNWLLIPLLVAMSYAKFGLDGRTYTTASQFSQYFTPVLSIWWLLFSFSEFIEADGNEILFVNEKVKIKDYLVIQLAYVVSLIPPLAFYILLFPNFFWEGLILFIQCAVFSAAAYLIVFAVHSVAATFLSLIVYEFITVFFSNGESAFGYYHFDDASPMMIVEKYLLFLLAAIAMLLVAVRVNARFRHYN